MKAEKFFIEYFRRRPRERMTIFQLAEAAGVGKNAVISAKTGKNMSLHNLEKILATLGYELVIAPIDAPLSQNEGQKGTICEQ